MRRRGGGEEVVVCVCFSCYGLLDGLEGVWRCAWYFSAKFFGGLFCGEGYFY